PDSASKSSRSDGSRPAKGKLGSIPKKLARPRAERTPCGTLFRAAWSLSPPHRRRATRRPRVGRVTAAGKGDPGVLDLFHERLRLRARTRELAEPVEEALVSARGNGNLAERAER